MPKYSNSFSYLHFIDNAIVHDDGYISVFAEVVGSDVIIDTLQDNWEKALNELPPGATIEIHMMRDFDDLIVQKYKQKKIERNNEMVRYLLDEYADHISKYAMRNRVFIVVNKKASKSPKKQVEIIRQCEDYIANSLNQYVETILLNKAAIESIINFSLRGQMTPMNLDHRFVLSDQFACEKPAIFDRGFSIAGRYYRCGVLYLYPGVFSGWVANLLSHSIQTHICQVIRPESREKTERDSDIEAKQLRRFADDKNNVQRQQQKMLDVMGFTDYVIANDLSTYKNCYYISISGSIDDVDFINSAWSSLCTYVSTGNDKGLVIDSHQYAIPAYQYMAVAQGYHSPYMRVDHSEQVVGMLPIHVPSPGVDNPTNIRLRTDGSVFGSSIVDMDVPHAFTVAKTGAGKGVNSCCDILENYAQGIDHMILEVGTSYQWLVESLGGEYISVEPDKTAINPMPALKEFRTAKENGKTSQLIGATRVGLSYLLLDDDEADLNVEQVAALDDAIKKIYDNEENENPVIKDLRDSLRLVDSTENIKKEAIAMADHLDAFLRTSEGALFNSTDTIDLTGSLIGFNLKNASNNLSLLRFYIIFLSIKFQARAFSNNAKIRIVLDEIHQFSSEAPKAFSRLVKTVTRMGRKEGSYVHLITQHLDEIESLDAATIDSMTIKNLLHRDTEHDLFIDKLSISNKAAIDFWKGIENPEGLSYRKGLSIVGGDVVTQFLTFPETLLLISNTSDKVLKAKDIISNDIDPFERLQKLKELL